MRILLAIAIVMVAVSAFAADTDSTPKISLPDTLTIATPDSTCLASVGMATAYNMAHVPQNAGSRSSAAPSTSATALGIPAPPECFREARAVRQGQGV